MMHCILILVLHSIRYLVGRIAVKIMKNLLDLSKVLLLVLFSATAAYGESTFHALSNLSVKGSTSFAPMKDGELAAIEGGIAIMVENGASSVILLGYAASTKGNNAEVSQSGKSNESHISQHGGSNIATIKQTQR